MSNHEAPERIWAFLYTGSHTKGEFETTSISWGTEYVRADIAASQLAEARAEYLTASKDAMELAGKLNAAEAERDRLAADNARKDAELRDRDRLIHYLVSWIEDDVGAELPLDEDQFNLARSIRAALAGKE